MKKVVGTLCLFCGLVFSFVVDAEPPAGDGPTYVNGTHLVRPANYREWVFLGAGLGLTYDAAAAEKQSKPQSFTNVFVNPSSYRGFMTTGKWPDKTVFVLEVRNAGNESSLTKGGKFQADFRSLEAEVKDSQFADGWAYYNFGTADSAEPLSGKAVASCIECHTKHTAVERTFVQFYPTLMDVARRMGTINPAFKP